MSDNAKQNIDYQGAKSLAGGSYTDNKLQRLKLPPLAGKKFLDLGCNTGFYCRLALESGAIEVTGVDNSPTVIAKARADSPSSIVYRDTGWDNFPPIMFDVAILLSAIHYAKDPRAVVRNVRRGLEPDGVLILEGGVLFVGESRVTDIPLPGWRKVGDRCLHLTEGFVRRHLLCDFDWRIVGESEMRGGDDVARFVIHAEPTGAEHEMDVFTLDVLDYFAAAKQSANTIVTSQQAYDYVAPLSKVTDLDSVYVSKVLSDPKSFDSFIKDLLYCLDAARPLKLRLHKTLSKVVLSNIKSAIATKVEVQLV